MINKTLIEKHISVTPGIQHGKPCVKGTRTPVHIILESLAMGMSAEDLKREFAPLTDDGIRACMLFAALLADEQELINQPT